MSGHPDGGVNYNDDFWLQRCRDAWKQYQIDPSKLYTYSAWDAVPGSPRTRETYARWLNRYLPLVEEGTWAWLEIGASSLFSTPLPKDVVASVFANRQLHLVLANFSRSDARIQTSEPFLSTISESPEAQTDWTIPPRSLLIVRRSL